MLPGKFREARNRKRRNSKWTYDGKRNGNQQRRKWQFNLKSILMIFVIIATIYIILNLGFYIHLDDSMIPVMSMTEYNPATVVIPKNQRLKNKDICPYGWPDRIPSISSLKEFCQKISCDSKWEKGIAFNERYKITTNERRKNLESMLLPSMDDKENDAVILMSVNYGFWWLFANWACSLENNLSKAQIENIKKKTIVVVTDEKAQKAVNEMGFMTHYPDWLGDKLLSGIEEEGAIVFGFGSLKEINALSIALLNDLVSLNFNVLMQDVDVVWNKEPINYLMNEVDADLCMMDDGRFDNWGPGNSGFLFIESNCKTKMFMETLWRARSQIEDQIDQSFWNSMVDDKSFRQLNFHILDHDLFGWGNQINLVNGGELHSNHFIFHACWTDDVWDKVEKFYMTDHLYFQSHLCPYYNESMVVDIRKRYKQDERINKQEAKFLKLGLFRNGTRATKQKVENSS